MCWNCKFWSVSLCFWQTRNIVHWVLMMWSSSLPVKYWTTIGHLLNPGFPLEWSAPCIFFFPLLLYTKWAVHFFNTSVCMYLIIPWILFVTMVLSFQSSIFQRFEINRSWGVIIILLYESFTCCPQKNFKLILQ